MANPTLFPTPDLGIFADAIQKAQAESAANNPLTQLSGLPMKLQDDPLEGAASDQRHHLWEGLASGILGGLGNRVQAGRNEDVTNAALGSMFGDAGNPGLPANVFSPIENAAKIFKAHNALQTSAMQANLALEMMMKKSDQDAEYKKAIDVAKLEHPEAALLAGSGGGAGSPSTVATDQPTAPIDPNAITPFATLVKKLGSLEGAKEQQKGEIDQKLAKEKKFNDFLEGETSKLRGNRTLVDALRTDIAGSGDTGFGAPTGDLSRSITGAGADTLGARKNMQQDAIKIMQSLRGGEDGKGSIPIRNQTEFNYFVGATPSESNPAATNTTMVNKLDQANQVHKAYIDFMGLAKQKGMPQEKADSLYESASSSAPLLMDGGKGLNPLRFDGQALLGKAMFDSLPAAQKQTLVGKFKEHGGTEKIDFFKLLASE